MSGPREAAGQRVLTPAVVGAAAFALLAALVSVVFVTSRGGLQMPTAGATSPIALASVVPSPTASGVVASQVPSGPSPSPSAPPASSAPSQPPGGPTATPGRPDPILALPPCPDHPDCYQYTVRRGDSYTAVSDRLGVGLWIMDALNPEVVDKGLIVVGQVLYVGHDPTARLDLCPDATCHLYRVRSGDTLARIAGRYGLSVAGIRIVNPGLDPSSIVTGQVIRLPLYQPA